MFRTEVVSKIIPRYQLSTRVYFTLILLAGIVLGVILTLTSQTILSPLYPFSAHPKSLCRSDATISLQQLDENTVEEITRENVDFKYLKEPDILIVGMAKSGTTSFWNWAYNSMTGSPYNCSRYVQSLNDSPCWSGKSAFYLYQLNITERMRILTSPDTLRVALWRDPFERMISVWKSKVTCEGKRFGTDKNGRTRVVRNLRNAANLSPKLCLDIDQFADSLEEVRARIELGETSMRRLDPHMRVQQHYSHFIKYRSVFTITEAANDPSLLLPIIQRMKFREIAKSGLPHLHGSKGEQIYVPEQAALKIAAFAALTKPRPLPTD